MTQLKLLALDEEDERIGDGPIEAQRRDEVRVENRLGVGCVDGHGIARALERAESQSETTTGGRSRRSTLLPARSMRAG